ncbi:aminotransferase DegT [Thiocapsa imhoffii]|uniref:Aminotransferase DegT n=1 Tax=Thiocapsa imhoffii TaxID=382777 RepID=A0A9X1BBA8_9GAMM|nr:LegC family aminotransferase [Thiocapsa imhoffii]MBK1646550.1 aminotransferase DegT [Thiocapsa imhoffii]
MEQKRFSRQLVAAVRSRYGIQDAVIPLHAPSFGVRDREAVLEAIDSGFVSSVGRHVDDFEAAVASFTGAGFAVATVNGTAALHVALLLGGVHPGDEVITQTITFVATCNAIHYTGARPLFVDIDRDTLSLSPESLSLFLDAHAEIRDDGLCWNRDTNRVIRACLPMHTCGHPARIDRIAAVCERWHLVLIEDAAESLGSLYLGRHTGTFGRLGAVSFNGNKIITTGGGGMILTDDEHLARRAKHLTTTAKQPHPFLFLHDEVGFNYRLPALNAALGCAQMLKLEGDLEQKRALAEDYAAWFAETDYPFIREPAGARSNYWLNAFLTHDRKERDDILEETNALGVMTRPLWTPMHRLAPFAHCPCGDLTNSDWIEARLVKLPSSVPVHGH